MKSITLYCHAKFAAAAALAVAILASPTASQTSSTEGRSTSSKTELRAGIAWYGVLQDGMAEARRTGRPIMYLTATPQCNGVPGMW